MEFIQGTRENMYCNITLASDTVESINRVWNAYNWLYLNMEWTVLYLSQGGDDTLDPDFSPTKVDRQKDLAECSKSIEKEIRILSRLYPAETLQSTFQQALESIQEIQRLLSEFDLSDILCVPGLKGSSNDALQSRLAEFESDIHSIVSAITNYIQTTTPLSGHQAKLITSELIKQNPQAAIQQIFTLFEDRLRKRIGATPGQYGENLINAAFGKQGILAYGETSAEQAGLRNLLSGAYATFRNPRMHRMMKDNDETVIAVITLVDWLIKIVDEAKDSAKEGK